MHRHHRMVPFLSCFPDIFSLSIDLCFHYNKLLDIYFAENWQRGDIQKEISGNIYRPKNLQRLSSQVCTRYYNWTSLIDILMLMQEENRVSLL